MEILVYIDGATDDSERVARDLAASREAAGCLRVIVAPERRGKPTALNVMGAAATGIVAIAAGIYELTPLKHACRERCRHTVRSGAQFGIYCVGSSIGLMAMLVAVDVMSMAWCVVIGALITAQKLLPPRAYVDVPVGLGIVGLGLAMLA